MTDKRIAFVASETPEAQDGLGALVARYGHTDPVEAELLVVLGGDGFMLQTLHGAIGRNLPIYGMHKGTVGFLMNEFREDELEHRLDRALQTELHPLTMSARDTVGASYEALAINEVSLHRETRQAAKISIRVDNKVRVPELICDGVLVATPAGSSAYNLSVNGPVLPLEANLLALTPVSAFRPRRWRGALLKQESQIHFEVDEPTKRPVSVTADQTEIRDVVEVAVSLDFSITLKVLFDPEHNLEERILNEQFQP